MTDSLRVLNRSSGSLDAEVMFVGEAPGRLGADGTGIPFHGDKAGHNFEDLLSFVGLEREKIYVTNAVLCNPRDEHGNNATPIQREIANCSHFLRRQIELINPIIIVTLGASPLAALKGIEEHHWVLRESVRHSFKWFNRILIPLYHPGQRAMISRSMANQRSDYQFVVDELRKSKETRRDKSYGKSRLNVALIIDYLFHKKSSYTYFALHKLFYLIEYKCFQKLGKRVTNCYIVRQKDGPYCTDLHLFKLQKALPYIKTKTLSKSNVLLYKEPNSFFGDRLIDQYEIEDEIRGIVDEVLIAHGGKSNASLKRTVYFSRPMRDILALESEQKLNLYNTPILFDMRPSCSGLQDGL